MQVYNTAGRIVAKGHMQRGQHFRFPLPAGRYELEAIRRRSGTPEEGCSQSFARVRAGRTTQVQISIGCDIP